MREPKHVWCLAEHRSECGISYMKARGLGDAFVKSQEGPLKPDCLNCLRIVMERAIDDFEKAESASSCGSERVEPDAVDEKYPLIHQKCPDCNFTASAQDCMVTCGHGKTHSGAECVAESMAQHRAEKHAPVFHRFDPDKPPRDGETLNRTECGIRLMDIGSNWGELGISCPDCLKAMERERTSRRDDPGSIAEHRAACGYCEWRGPEREPASGEMLRDFLGHRKHCKALVEEGPGISSLPERKREVMALDWLPEDLLCEDA